LKLFSSLKSRFIIFFITFIVALTLVLILTGVRSLSQTVIDAFSSQGVYTVERTAEYIDGDRFEELVKWMDVEDPYYEETRVWMLNFKGNTNCLYLYTMAKNNKGNWCYIIDGSAPPDDEEEFSALGDEQDVSEFDPAFRRVWVSGETEVSGLVDQGEWGWLMSIYTPIKNSSGQIVGVVGCDYDGTELRAEIISREIQQGIIGGIFIIIGIVILIILMRMIFNPIRDINHILDEISEGEGDLTRRIKIKDTHEIGKLAVSFNLTLDKIKNLVVGIKKQTEELTSTGNDLATNMRETATAISQITAHIKNIKERILSQSASVSETHATMEHVVENINKLDSHVEIQSSNVSTASSAIEEMVANTQSVTNTLIANVTNVQELKNASELGRGGIQAVVSDIKEIARESEGLLEINSVMENIASQTNLLSMNAAIEAAHAGESGKGFAVVAGEIRKLAENSSRQSKTISEVLKRMKSAVDKITRSTNNVLEKFEAIDKSVNVVAFQEDNIRNAMEEQQMGSKQILEGISNVNMETKKVKSGSKEMLEGAKEVIQESSNLETVTQDITDGMNEMDSGADQINVAVRHINHISDKNRENIGHLVTEVSRFKV